MSEVEARRQPENAPAASRARWRAPLLALLTLVELPLIAFVYDPFMIEASDPAWRMVQSALKEASVAAIFAIVAFAVLLAPSRASILNHWRSLGRTSGESRALIANLALFPLWLGVTKLFNIAGAGRETTPWLLFTLWTAGVFALYALLARAAAPAPFWRRFAARFKWHGVLALGAGALVLAAARLSQQSWSALSDATFSLSALLLRATDPNIISDPAERVLGVESFAVNIAAACSGYEGIGLVLVFLTLYLWIFRRELLFPNAWVLLPIGVVAIWLLNGVRIAALILIGAHFSEDVAMTGFHSQAGWMMFLFLTIAIMLAAHHLSFFRRDAEKTPPSDAYRLALALLAPFLAMTGAGIVAAAFSNGGHWLYALRVIAIGGALLWFLPVYRTFNWRIGWEPVVLGLLVGALWIATDPGRGQPSELGAWLGGLAPGAAALWIAMRVVGTVMLVPIAEEAVFRGYLHRKLVADRFETVAEAAFSLKAFLVTSILFGALHERWLAGALAGAVFAIALYRSGKLTGAIAAHAIANAVIAFWAIAFGQWSLM